MLLGRFAEGSPYLGLLRTPLALKAMPENDDYEKSTGQRSPDSSRSQLWVQPLDSQVAAQLWSQLISEFGTRSQPQKPLLRKTIAQKKAPPPFGGRAAVARRLTLGRSLPLGCLPASWQSPNRQPQRQANPWPFRGRLPKTPRSPRPS